MRRQIVEMAIPELYQSKWIIIPNIKDTIILNTARHQNAEAVKFLPPARLEHSRLGALPQARRQAGWK